MRINLYCPYREKDEAKALGARWDSKHKTWYIKNESDLEKFSKWLPSAQEIEAKKKKSEFKPRTTGTYKPICECDVLPWEDCEHTEISSHNEMMKILQTDGFSAQNPL